MQFGRDTYQVRFQPMAVNQLDALYHDSCRLRREVTAALVGHYSYDRGTAIVRQVILSTVGEPTSVERDSVRMTRVLKDLWDKTDGCIYFIGEWHSHPDAMNWPSRDDVTTALDTANDPKANCAEMIMAIQGRNGLGVWIASRKASALISLEPVL